MAVVEAPVEHAVSQRRVSGWTVVLAQELRDLWLGGRGLVLCFVFSILVSVIAYLVASSTGFNFLEQRESASLTLQAAITCGGLLALLVAADSVSGERERGTLETMLLTPVPRRQIAVGKLLAALSLWLACFVVAIPYVWLLGRDVGVVDEALVAGFVVGTLLALFLVSVGLVLSVFASSNRISLSVSLFLLLALLAPTQLPSGVEQAWAGELVVNTNPLTAGIHYIGRIVISGHGWSDDVHLLYAPVLAACVSVLVAIFVAGRFMRLRGGVSG